MKFRIILICVFVLALGGGIFASDDEPEWRPVTPQELQMKKPLVEPDADAEAIFWETRVDDSKEDLIQNNYVRVKIFTETGRDKYSKIDVPYYQNTKISDFRARVIKADGSIITLEKSEMFEREILKAEGIKIKAKSFVIPNLDLGSIVEFRYKEKIKISLGAMYLRFQHDVPIERVTFYLKAFTGGHEMKTIPHNMGAAAFVLQNDGFSVVTLNNVPAFRAEPKMPPIDQVTPWIYVFYDRFNSSTIDNYWRGFAGLGSDWYRAFTPTREITASLPGIIGDAKTPDDKLSKIFQFCKTRISNVTYDTALTDEDRTKISDKIFTASDVLKGMRGNVYQIDDLFAALATAAGFECRYAFSGDRRDLFFDPSFANAKFLHLSFIAVKDGAKWRYFEPGSRFTPEGMLPWFEEKAYALVVGKDDHQWVNAELSGPERSQVKRTGRFELLEDGTLQGNITVEYTGHMATDEKLSNYNITPPSREKRIVDDVKRRINSAEVTNINLFNATDPEKNPINTYNVRIPNYAVKTGKRLFLQPGFFERGEKPLFSSSERKHKICFPYPWSESDDIEIRLPANYLPENMDAPAAIADPKHIAALTLTIGLADNVVKYKRWFFFGGGGAILFPVESYIPLKNMFDSFNKADSHVITLKQT